MFAQAILAENYISHVRDLTYEYIWRPPPSPQCQVVADARFIFIFAYFLLWRKLCLVGWKPEAVAGFSFGGGASSQGPKVSPSKIENWLDLTYYSFKGARFIKNKINQKETKRFVSLRGPVPGLKGPIPGLKGTIPGPKGPIPGFRRPISGLKRSIPGLGFYLRPDKPISGLRRSFASLRRSNLGLISNLVHSSLCRVYPRPERIDFRSENWSPPPLGMRNAFSCPRD